MNMILYSSSLHTLMVTLKTAKYSFASHAFAIDANERDQQPRTRMSGNHAPAW